MKFIFLVASLISMSFAHTTMRTSGGFASGFMHPISELDHILAMLGVGMLAYFSLKRGYLTLVAFMSAMFIAAYAGHAGMHTMGIEDNILLSIIVIFGLVGFANKLSINFIVAIVAFFGMFHGFAHGVEFHGGSFASYMFGFGLCILLLHISGIGLGFLYQKSLLILQRNQVA